MIEIQHLNKWYGQHHALNNICLTFSKGQLHGLMGENGAGKSTLFNCILKLETYDGDIYLPYGATIGYMPDTLFFYPYVTGMEYIEFCMKARNKSIPYERIEQLNAKFQLPLDRYAANYSMGMKKRLAILTLMIEDDDVLIMDEPFNGLDLSATIILKQWLLSMKSTNKNIIISSHITSSLTEICDDIFYIHQGQVVEHYVGATPEMIERDITKKYITSFPDI